jgi:hypothetical protein
MARDARPAVVFLRMSPQLRDGLRDAATTAGCSLNAFAVQVLAAAAGDPGRFRQSGLREESESPDLNELERDHLGYPLERIARANHIGARTDFIGTMGDELGADEMVKAVKRIDAEEPGYFVEWQVLKNAERAARESERHRGAA